MNKTKKVAVIGAGLTGLVTAYYLKKSGYEVSVLEKADRTGGVIKTEKKEDFLYELGPNTGVFSSPELVALFDDLEGKCKVEFANEKAKYRWILKKGRWHALPSGPVSAIKTPLFRFKDKIRILFEPFRKKGTNPDESVAEMVKRRLGKSFLEYAVDPFISGIYAGDPEKLITRHALPKLYNLEQNYGSFIKGSLKKRKEPKDELTRRATKEVFSVEGGLEQLIKALSEEIGEDHIHTSVKDLHISPSGGGFEIKYHNHGKEQKQFVGTCVTTVGGYALKNILPFVELDAMSPVSNLTYARVVQVVAMFKDWKGLDLKAFGALVPGKEDRDILGILFPSSIFNNRAPENGALLSVFMGGRKKEHIFNLSNEEIKDIALKEINDLMQCKECIPDHLVIARYEHAIPQYEIDSELRYSRIAEIEEEYPGLLLGGNIRGGIGMSDRVKQGVELANKIIK